MSAAEEQARARAYRAQQKARIRNKRARERALKGDPAAARAVVDATKALLPVDADGVPRVGFEQ